MVSLPPLFLILCLAFPVLFLFFFQFYRTSKNPPRPPGPKGLPIIGNLHQLDNSILYYQLWQLSKKYGPLFSLQLGLRPAIVVSSPKIAKEVLKDHDPNFSGRPKLLGQQKLSYNGLDMAFSPYNEYWRRIRKICAVHLFSSKRVSCFSSVRHFELKQVIRNISMHASSSKVINLSEVLRALTSNIICRIAVGKKYEDENEGNRFHVLFNECEAMLATFFVSDYIPFLGWIDKLRGLHGRLQRNFEKMDRFYEEVIEEHMHPCRKIQEEEDIIDVLLQLKKHHSIDLTVDHIKAVLMNILIGATDTTTATTVWAMTELIKNPGKMKKVQEEIRNLGGKKDFLVEDDIQKFTYFRAVIKETLRMHLPAPLLVPREAIEKCIVNGYEIPAKTLVYVDAWAIHRDPEAWKDPEEFLPERFLDSDIDLRGQDFELIPFGAGRRICPGLAMGLASVDLMLANLLYSFDWEFPVGLESELESFELLPGITQNMKKPLLVLAKCFV